MIPTKQRRRHNPDEGIYGDCARAAFASILEIPYDDVPDFTFVGNQYEEIRSWLRRLGYDVCRFLFLGSEPLDKIQERMADWNPNIYYLLSGRSSIGIGHIVVCLNGEIAHDPSLDNTGIVGPLKHVDSDETSYVIEFITAPVTVTV